VFNDPEIPVKSVKMLKNSLGQNSGKALFEYNTKEDAYKAIKKYSKMTQLGNRIIEMRPY